MKTIKTIILCGALVLPLGQLSEAVTLRLVKHGKEFFFPTIGITSLKPFTSQRLEMLEDLRKTQTKLMNKLDKMIKAKSESTGIAREKLEKNVTEHTIKLEVLSDFIEEFAEAMGKRDLVADQINDWLRIQAIVAPQ